MAQFETQTLFVGLLQQVQEWKVRRKGTPEYASAKQVSIMDVEERRKRACRSRKQGAISPGKHCLGTKGFCASLGCNTVLNYVLFFNVYNWAHWLFLFALRFCWRLLV